MTLYFQLLIQIHANFSYLVAQSEYRSAIKQVVYNTIRPVSQSGTVIFTCCCTGGNHKPKLLYLKYQYVFCEWKIHEYNLEHAAYLNNEPNI